jgi:hypothetical protein
MTIPAYEMITPGVGACSQMEQVMEGHLDAYKSVQTSTSSTPRPFRTPNQSYAIVFLEPNSILLSIERIVNEAVERGADMQTTKKGE